jgi:DNA polymerase-3 subunit gamma/tau
MRLAIAAITAVLLLACAAPAAAQDATGATKEQGSTTVKPAPATESVGVSVSPKTRRKLLQGLLNAIAPPRPAVDAAPVEPPAVAQPAAAPANLPGAGSLVPTPPPPRPTTGAGPAPVVIAPVLHPASSTSPKPLPTIAPAAPRQAPRTVPSPAPAAPIAPQSLVPVAAPTPGFSSPAAPGPAAVEPTGQTQMPEAVPSGSIFGANTLPLLLGLIAALAAIAAATVLRMQRSRRIERTRAALMVTPRLDLTAGPSAIHGLSLGS